MTTGKKGLVKNIASLGIVQIANFVMPLISVPVISRIIGPDKFGAVNFAGAFVVYFNLFIGYGFHLTATRRIAQDPDNLPLRSRIFSEVFYCQSILFLVSLALFGIFLYTVPALAADKRMALFAFLFCISSVLTQNWLFQAMQDMPRVAVLNLLGKVIYLIAVLSLIRQKEDYFWQPLALSLTQILVAFISFNWARTKYGIHLVRVSLQRCLALLRAERAVFFSLVFTTLYTTANIVILGLFQAEDQVGYYTAAQRLITVSQTVITLPLAQVFYPYIGRAFGQSRDKGLQSVQKLVPFVIMLTGAIAAGVLLLGPTALTAFYGEAFTPASRVFQILAFVPMMHAINNIMGIQIMLNLKMDKLYFRVIGIATCISVCTNMFMSWKWGYTGCAVNWLLTELLITGVMYQTIRRKNIRPLNLHYFHYKVIAQSVKPLTSKLKRGTKKTSVI